MPQLRGDPIIHDNRIALISDPEIELWSNVTYRSLTSLNDHNLFFVLMTCLCTLAVHIMNTPLKDENRAKDLVCYTNRIIENAKLSLVISMLSPKNNYTSLYPFFLKTQILIDFELQF